MSYFILIISLFFVSCGADDYEPEPPAKADEALILVDETTGGISEPQVVGLELYIDGKLIDVFNSRADKPNDFKDCFYRTAYCSGACSVVSNPNGFRVIAVRDLGDGIETNEVTAPSQCEISPFSYKGSFVDKTNL